MRSTMFVEFGCAAGLTLAAMLSGAFTSRREAQSAPVKIGVLTDLSGFAADSGGRAWSLRSRWR